MTHPSEDHAARGGPHPHCRLCRGTGHYRSPSTGVDTTCNCPEWATRPLRGDSHAIVEAEEDNIIILRGRVAALEDTVSRLVKLCTSKLNAIATMLETPAKELCEDDSTTQEEEHQNA